MTVLASAAVRAGQLAIAFLMMCSPDLGGEENRAQADKQTVDTEAPVQAVEHECRSMVRVPES